MSRKNYLGLLCDTGELSALLAGSTDVQTFFARTVEMVSRHLSAGVCSIYLFDEVRAELVLKATVGLNPGAVDRVRLQVGEGLVGLALDEMRPVLDNQASLNPRFKHFDIAGEDAFDAFLAVPILRGIEKVGVLVVQRRKGEDFDEHGQMALRAIASQLATAIENARVLVSARVTPASEEPITSFGNGMVLIPVQIAASGCASGYVSRLRGDHEHVSSSVSDRALHAGLADLDRAIDETVRQLADMQERLARQVPEIVALVFTAHLMMLKDKGFAGRIRGLVQQGKAVVDAVGEVAGIYRDIFLRSSQAYMREKVNDVEDVARRILMNLGCEDGQQLVSGRVVVAATLYPSDIVRMWVEQVAGVVMVGGGVTSHVSIIARALELPLVITEDRRFLSLVEGCQVIVDAEGGNVYVNPVRDVVQRFADRSRAREKAVEHESLMASETRTADGVRVCLMANINLLSELTIAIRLKAEGVGLYRTEFPFLIRSSFPSEEEQVVVYRKLFNNMSGREVTVRTLDVGGEKVLAYFDHGEDVNPELGLRSIRFCLAHRDVFRQQISAVLRSAVGHPNVRIMFPMISSLDELREARAVVRECMEALKIRGEPCNENVSIGMMVELPSVVSMMDAFCQEVDFFSIGTNDFVQYMLGVDRCNEKVASYYCPHHPAVLRGLAAIVGAAVRYGKDVSLCGEMAHQPDYLPFLLGIGVRKLSVDPHCLPQLQQMISCVRLPDALETAGRLLNCTTIPEIEAILSAKGGCSDRSDHALPFVL